MAGINNKCGLVFIPLIASLARLPKEGSGTATPIPKKLKKLSVKIEDGICKVVVTIKVPIQLVNKWFLIILPLLTPKALAAVIIKARLSRAVVFTVEIAG